MKVVKTDRCPCGGIILADTEDWKEPLCHECWIPWTRIDVPELKKAHDKLAYDYAYSQSELQHAYEAIKKIHRSMFELQTVIAEKLAKQKAKQKARLKIED